MAEKSGKGSISKLSTKVQSLLQTADGDEQTPVAYSSSSGGIVDTLTDMKEKAEESLSSTRKDEMEAAHAYALLKQGILGSE